MSAGTRYPGAVGLAGLGLGALAGVLAALAAAYDWAEGPERFSVGSTVVDYPVGVAAVGIVGAVLVTATMAAPWLWARLTGIGLVAGFGTIYAVLVLAARTSTDFEIEAEVELLTGSHLAILAYFASAAGLALALLGGRATQDPAAPPAPDLPPPAASYVPPEGGYGYGRLPPLEGPPPAPAGRGTSGKAITSMVRGILGVVSIVAPPLSALAVAFASLARADIRRSGRRMGGGGMATAGLVLGLVGLALSALILTTVMFVLTPDEMGTFDYE